MSHEARAYLRNTTPERLPSQLPDPRQVGYERGLNRVILALVTAVAIALAFVAVAGLQGCAAPQLPRTDAERVTYCANLERSRADVQRYADTEGARWAFGAQLDEQARAGGCKP